MIIKIMKKLLTLIVIVFITSNNLLAQDFWSNTKDGPTSVEAAKKIFSFDFNTRICRKLDWRPQAQILCIFVAGLDALGSISVHFLLI